MTEEFLHYLWRFQSIKPGPWKGAKGEIIELIDPGNPNFNSGPDFESAQLRIDEQIWIGNVELHLQSSDWDAHRHQFDPAYNNVILHVVYEHNQEVLTESGAPMPTLELKGLFNPEKYLGFEQLLQSKQRIVCAPSFPKADFILKEQMLQRCGITRLEDRCQEMERTYQFVQGDWDALLYMLLAKTMGAKVNQEPMEILARIVPLRLWRKYAQDHELRMCLFLGMSGLLIDQFQGQIKTWQEQFYYLAHKHQLRPMPKANWKYARLRPAAFPDRRIALLSALLPYADQWFRLLRKGRIHNMEWPEIPEYWLKNYRLENQSDSSTKRRFQNKWPIGLIRNLEVNAFVPMMFFYGRKTGNQSLQDEALNQLSGIPAEQNFISRSYEQLGLPIRSAFDSQACITWYQRYCRPKKCLTCSLGNELLNR